jgi:hypothetical protein
MFQVLIDGWSVDFEKTMYLVSRPRCRRRSNGAKHAGKLEGGDVGYPFGHPMQNGSKNDARVIAVEAVERVVSIVRTDTDSRNKADA